MVGMLRNVRNSIRGEGVASTVRRTVASVRGSLEKRRRMARSHQALRSAQARFTWIYQHNYGRSNESASGRGSTRRAIESLRNLDIFTGNFRLIDLFVAPFHLPAEPLARMADWAALEPEREMCLWSREQPCTALQRFR